MVPAILIVNTAIDNTLGKIIAKLGSVHEKMYVFIHCVPILRSVCPSIITIRTTDKLTIRERTKSN